MQAPSYRPTRLGEFGGMVAQPLRARDRHLPGEGSGRVPGEVDDGGLDGIDLPFPGESSLNLVVHHPARSPVARLAVTETEHVISTTRRNHCSQVVNVPLAFVVIENVEEPAVEYRIELFGQINKAKGVHHQESRFDAPLGRLPHRQLDGLCREIDPHHFVAECSRQKGMLAGTAARIEHLPDQVPGAGQTVEGRLGRPMSQAGGVSDA